MVACPSWAYEQDYQFHRRPKRLIDFSGCVLFCMLCLLKQFVHHLLSPLQKCNNHRDYGHPINFQICGRWTALTSIQLTTISGSWFSNESRVQKCRMWRIWCSVWLIPGYMSRRNTGLAVFRCNTSVWRTDGQTPHYSKDRAMQSVACVINESFNISNNAFKTHNLLAFNSVSHADNKWLTTLDLRHNVLTRLAYFFSLTTKFFN